MNNDQYWETVSLIKEINFTNEELIQLLANDLQQYELESVREYLSESKKAWNESKQQARDLLERVRELKEKNNETK